MTLSSGLSGAVATMRRRSLVCSWNEPVADACCLLVFVGMPSGNHNMRGKQNPCSRAVSIITSTLSTRPEVECWPYLVSSVGPCSMKFAQGGPGCRMRGMMWLPFSHESHFNTDYRYTLVPEPIRSVGEREAL